MPKFLYTGKRHDDPRVSDGNEAASTTMFGVVFQKGVATEVRDPLAVRKLSRNSYFLMVADEPVGFQDNPDPSIGAGLSPAEAASVVLAAADEPINAMLAPEPKSRKRAKKETA